MRIDESAEPGSQPFDDGFSLNPASELHPMGLLIPEAVLEGTAEGTLTQSELDLRAGEHQTRICPRWQPQEVLHPVV